MVASFFFFTWNAAILLTLCGNICGNGIGYNIGNFLNLGYNHVLKPPNTMGEFGSPSTDRASVSLGTNNKL
jgi:hypothetical protein